MDGSVAIRDATDDDLPTVAAIFGHYVLQSVATFDETPPSAADWRRKRKAVRDRGLPFLVATIEGEVEGFAYASAWREKPAYRHTAEDTIYLAPGAVGRGIGRRLLSELVRACDRAGTRQLIAVIADTGVPASVALHRACGFTEAGTLHRVGFKHDRWVDTTLMQRATADR